MKILKLGMKQHFHRQPKIKCIHFTWKFYLNLFCITIISTFTCLLSAFLARSMKALKVLPVLTNWAGVSPYMTFEDIGQIRKSLCRHSHDL